MQSNIYLKQLIRQRWKSNAKFPEFQQTNKQTGNNHSTSFQNISTVNSRQARCFFLSINLKHKSLTIKQTLYQYFPSYPAERFIIYFQKALILTILGRDLSQRRSAIRQVLSDTNSSFIVYIMQCFHLLWYKLYTFI